MPIDPLTTKFDQPNPSYESTVLFMIANFQYLVTCVAFSIAKPFRLPIWSNIPFTICIIVLVILGTLIVFLPDGNFIAKIFDMLPYTESNDYRAWITVGILLNTILTFGTEKFIMKVVTARADQNLILKKKQRFQERMERYRLNDS